MSNDIVKKAIRTVTKLFLDADVMGIPEYHEVRDEFEILDEVYTTDEMIREVQYHITYYLDEKYPDAGPGYRYHYATFVAWWYQRDRDRGYPQEYTKLDMSDGTYISTPWPGKMINTQNPHYLG